MATFSFEEGAAQQPQDVSAQRPEPVAQKKTFSFEEGFAAPDTRKPEEVGFLEAIPAAAKRGLGSYGDIASGYGVAASSVMGDKEAARQKMEAVKAEAKRPQETPGMTWADFERISAEKGVTEALKEAPKYIVEQVLANAPQMAAPLVVGAGVGAVSGPFGIVTGPLAGIGTYAMQQFGNFMQRQAIEKKDPEELEVGKAAATAIMTAPLGYYVDKFTIGIGSAPVKQVGKEVVEELAKRGVAKYVKDVGAKGAKGATLGVLRESPTEWLEQVAERYQAGLPLTGEEAKKEYKEAIAGAAAVGGVGGGGGSMIQRGREIAAAKEQAKTFSFEEAQAPAMTKGERKDMEQAEDRARSAAAPKTPVDEFTDEILGKQPEKKTAETQAEPEAPVTKEPIKVDKDAGTIAGVAIQEIPVGELGLSKDVPQFKAEADEQGIVEPLKSEKYDRVGTPPIQVWRRADGTLEVISGRHRFDLARRTGEKTIPAQVFDESKGFNADMAAIMDAELNIRDEKGRITDYVNYFKKAGELGAGKQDFESRGLLDGQTGKRAYAVTVQGSDDLIHALNAGQIKDDQAYRIATAAPNDPRLQALGLKLVNEKPLEQAINILHAAKTIEPKAPEMGGDLFGFDDSGLKLAEDMGKLALEKQRALSADINTIERAGKQPAIAKKYGIDVKDPEAIKAKVKEMKAQRAAWDNWASDPKLVDQIRREIAGEPVAEAVPPEAKPEAAPIKIVKVEPSKWAGTGFGTKGASYGVEGDPNIMIRRESHGWTAFDKTTNDSRFGETKAELEKELADNPFKPKIEEKPVEKNGGIDLSEKTRKKADNYYYALLDAGFERLAEGDPRTYKNAAGEEYSTIYRDGASVGMTASNALFVNRGRVNNAWAPGDTWTINGLIVEKGKRGKGVAAKAMEDLTKLADKYNINLHLEPTPIEDKPMTAEQLVNFYKKFGFKQQEAGSDKVLVREPGAVSEKTKEAKTPAQQLQDLVDEYNKKGEEVKAAMDIMEKAKAAGEDYRKQEGDYNERLAELVAIGQRHDKFKREYKAAKEEGDKVKSVKMRRDPMGTDYLVTLNDGRTAAIYKSDPGGDGGLGAWHIDTIGYKVPGPSQLGHVSSVLGYTKKEAVDAVAKKLDELEKYRIKKEPKAEEVTPSFELEPEKKLTAAEQKAATEREAKEIADRERDFFELTPRTPKEGAGDYLQQDLLGAAGFTYDDYKKFIDKHATEPGEPLVLRDVTMSEFDGYNDEANAKVDESVNDDLSAVPNMKDVEVDEKNITHTLERQAQAVEDYIELASQGKVTAKEFMASVRAAAASGEIAPDVFNAIEKIYKLYPNVLEGIRFETVAGAKKTGKYREAGHYQPLARMIRLFKDTSGVLEPDTVRHEIAHTMEQMMTPEQKRLIVRAWRDELIRASKAETTDAGHLFFINIAKYLRSPSFSTLKAMIKSMPNVSYYQYVNPSEYWAVNAEKILKSRGEGASKLKAMMSNLQEGVRAAFGTTNFSIGNKVFDQILNGDRFSNRMILSYVRKTKMKNYLGKEAPPATWDLGSSSWIDNMIYLWQDKNIDLLQIQKVIGDIRDETNGYVKEALSHSRTSTRMEEFGMNYVKPLADVMDKYNISKQQLHEYMLARHAPEANLEIGKINPSMGDSGSSITTEEANNYIRSLGEKRKAELDEAAKFADKIIHHTQDILVESGYELDTTIEGWNKKYKHYVPLYRKDIEYPKSGRLHGSAKASGAFSKSRMGSQKEVDDITKWIVIDHLRAIEKIENARVKNSLVALVAENPNPDFWFALDPSAVKDKDAMLKKLEKFGCDEKALEGFMKAPNVGVINKQTGLVEYKPDANIIRSGNVVATRMDGKDWYVVFNANNPRAWRMAQSINNQDVAQLDTAMRMHSYVSRFVAQINTQVNIAFGPFNFIKDSFGAYLNLSTTKLNGKTAEIYKKGWANIPRLYKIMQEERETGKAVTSKEAEKWYEFRKEGGVTGTKARFTDPKKEKDLLEDALKSMQAGNVTKMVHVTGKWISDWNDVFENAVRLATYETGLENGLSKQESAYIAKDLINFNRKGAKTQSANALFAFFNASVQGIERTARTLKGPAGVKIMTGGVMLGVVQALALHALGYRDDEPKEYIKEKNLIIPIIGTGRYFTIPYPPVFSMFPGLGRIATETIIGWSNGRDVKHKMFDAMSMIAGAFNPLGNNFGWQMVTPTPYDPIVAIIENKNAFGNPIYKEDRNNNPQVAYERTRDTTWEGFKLASQFLTYASGGDKYNKGKIDFTGDEISFLLGYYTGGTGRLLMNTFGAAKDFTTGDETPLYKIPLVGKLIGEVESQAATKDRFYANVKELAEMENVVKKKVEEKENVAQYFKEHPQARLINMANRIENDITALNKQRHELIKRGATVEQIRRIEKIKAEKMKILNDQYDKLR